MPASAAHAISVLFIREYAIRAKHSMRANGPADFGQFPTDQNTFLTESVTWAVEFQNTA
jgi:hypothetical protein